MTRTGTLALSLSVAMFVPALAGAAPYGGARLLAANVQTQTSYGFRLGVPDLIGEGEGMRVHGLLCRTTSAAAVPPSAVQVQRLDAAMNVTATARAHPVGMLNERNALGCAVYDVETPWTSAPSDILRVSAIAGQ